MKQKLLSLLLTFLCLLLVQQHAQSQSLKAGDIAFIGFNTEDRDANSVAPAITHPLVTANPPSRACVGNNITFSGATAYQWQVNSGAGFTVITNGGVISGATTATLTITSASAGMSGFQFKIN